MARKLPLRRRLTTAAAWPVGVGLTSWRYTWRTTPLHRRELEGNPVEDAPPHLSPDRAGAEIQRVEDGEGPMFHRTYRARIRDAQTSPEHLVRKLGADLNRVSPTELARFIKVEGEQGVMAVGDEYIVRMAGPWDGPVRVVALSPMSFRLVTLAGHLEAGQIEFSAADDDGMLVFTIESWARSGDRLAHLLYHHLRMAKEVQFHMWTSFIENVARLAGGRLTGGAEVQTRKVEVLPRPGLQLLGSPRARRALDDLHDHAVNFDPQDRSQRTAANGWGADDYRQALAPEPPGAPVAHGSWEVARRLMRDYEFADPAIVRAVYHPDQPLENRDMLLEARFHGLRFHLGVRVGAVHDETRSVDGRRARVWGWNYRTLQGHLEMGQMDYEVWKWLDTGEVEFRIHSFSRTSRIANPIVALGFRLLGPRERRKFLTHACERMARLTVAELGDGAARQDTIPRVADQVVVGPGGPP